MLPLRRRSARLASASKTPGKTKSPLALPSVIEHDEGQDGGVPSTLDGIVSSPIVGPKTPASSTPIKPPLSEMHPSKVHATMASAPSSGLRFGFADLKPSTTGGGRDQPSGIAQATPTRMAPPSSPFTFRFTRKTPILKLGPEAQQMMEEIREEAVKIKADLAAKREMELRGEMEANVTTRKIAKPKGKAGRYSAAHMVQFKKMDSIENHASSFRAQPGRSTPTVAGVKRSPSKASLDMDYDRSKHDSTVAQGKGAHADMRADGDGGSPTKRARKLLADDATVETRPISGDGTSIPRPKSAGKSGQGIPRSHTTLASLMTPTQASLARSAVTRDGTGLLTKSPSISTLNSIQRSTTAADLTVKSPDKGNNQPAVRSPGSRFDKVKSFLRAARPTPIKAASSIPQPPASAPKTALPRSATTNALPPAGSAKTPAKTPARGLSKRLMFTPEARRTVAAQQSPSPIKSGIPKSKTRAALGEIHYPTLDSVIAENTAEKDVCYPDLSGHMSLPKTTTDSSEGAAVPPAVPGTFTFRSDHTINFGSASPTGFGSSPGQASLRHVRPSILPTADMPGSFPNSVFGPAADKENESPEKLLPAVPHGIKNKKRYRVSSDEEEAEKEAEARAAKKQKQGEVPEGLALLAPRLVGASGKKPYNSSPAKSRAAGGIMTPSPAKKRAGLSLSRLNMLARPKMRQ